MSDAGQLWAEEAGDPEAPLVALIHGSMDRSAGMLKVSRRLDSAFRVLRYDRRGYGRSAPHEGPFTMAAQVADLVGLLAGRQAVLIGHSFGGNVALATAQRHPELVRGVAIYEAPLSWESWWPGSTAGGAALASGTAADAAERFLRRMIGDARWEALPEKTRATRRVEGEAMVAELIDLRAAAPWTPAGVRVPVVAAHGQHGAEHHQRGTAHVAGTIEGARLSMVPDAHHDAPFSRAAEFVELVVAPLLEAVGPPWAGRLTV